MKSGRKSVSGVAAVEFALVLPVLLVVLLGIIDYGYVFFVRLNMTNAAREGARVGVVQADPAVARTRATEAASLYLSNAGVAAETTATAPTTGDPEVTVSVTVGDFRPLVGFVPTPKRMSVSSSMRWELAP
jgi:Flp pilus assembly protein TadG